MFFQLRFSLCGPDKFDQFVRSILNVYYVCEFQPFFKLRFRLSDPLVGLLFPFSTDSFILKAFCAYARRISADKITMREQKDSDTTHLRLHWVLWPEASSQLYTDEGSVRTDYDAIFPPVKSRWFCIKKLLIFHHFFLCSSKQYFFPFDYHDSPFLAFISTFPYIFSDWSINEITDSMREDNRILQKRLAFI